jgi:Ca2+-binding EF-hand superfamily protein
MNVNRDLQRHIRTWDGVINSDRITHIHSVFKVYAKQGPTDDKSWIHLGDIMQALRSIGRHMNPTEVQHREICDMVHSEDNRVSFDEFATFVHTYEQRMHPERFDASYDAMVLADNTEGYFNDHALIAALTSGDTRDALTEKECAECLSYAFVDEDGKVSKEEFRVLLKEENKDGDDVSS